MTAVHFYVGIGVLLWLLGLQGLFLTRQALRRIIAVNLMGSGVFLVMVALANRSKVVDPVLQALVVTGLVVAVSATALALRLATGRQEETTAAKEEPSADERRPR